MTTYSYKTRLKKEYERVMKNGMLMKARHSGENVEKLSEDAFMEFLDIAIKAINKQIEELDKDINVSSKIFKNSPFEILNIAFEKLFPNVKYNAYFEPNIEQYSDGNTIYGLTKFESNGEITILIDSCLSISNATEIFAHELAHAGVGHEHEHDEVWKKAFDDLFNEYNKIGSEIFSSEVE